MRSISTASFQSQQHCFLTGGERCATIGAVREIKRNITKADQDAAARLLKIWDRKQDELDLTQEEAAARLGVNQSMFSQMLHGKTAIPLKIALLLADLLKVHVGDIRPEYGELADRATKRSPADQLVLDLLRRENGTIHMDDVAEIRSTMRKRKV